MTWLNTGHGWVQDPQWEFPDGYLVSSSGAAEGRELADVNGDGLVDVLRAHGGEPRVTWLNTGHGWVQDPQWEFPDGYLVSSSQPKVASWLMSTEMDWLTYWWPKPASGQEKPT